MSDDILAARWVRVFAHRMRNAERYRFEVSASDDPCIDGPILEMGMTLHDTASQAHDEGMRWAYDRGYRIRYV